MIVFWVVLAVIGYIAGVGAMYDHLRTRRAFEDDDFAQMVVAAIWPIIVPGLVGAYARRRICSRSAHYVLPRARTVEGRERE